MVKLQVCSWVQFFTVWSNALVVTMSSNLIFRWNNLSPTFFGRFFFCTYLESIVICLLVCIEKFLWESLYNLVLLPALHYSFVLCLDPDILNRFLLDIIKWTYDLPGYSQEQLLSFPCRELQLFNFPWGMEVVVI